MVGFGVDARASEYHAIVVHTPSQGLQRSFVMFLRCASLKRLVQVLAGVLDGNLRLCFAHWHRAVACIYWASWKQFLSGKHCTAHAAVSSDYVGKVSGLCRSLRGSCDTIGKPTGWQPAAGIAAPDVHQNKFDKEFGELGEPRQQFLDEASKPFQAPNLQLHCECDVMLKALSLLTTRRHGFPSGQDEVKLWPVDDHEVEVFQWGISPVPETWMVPFSQAVALEDQRQHLTTASKLLLKNMDGLNLWGGLATSRPVRTRQYECYHSPIAGANLLKSTIRRCTLRLIRPAFHKLVVTSRGLHLPTFKSSRPAQLNSGLPTASRQIAPSTWQDTSRQSVFSTRYGTSKQSASASRQDISLRFKRPEVMNQLDTMYHAFLEAKAMQSVGRALQMPKSSSFWDSAAGSPSRAEKDIQIAQPPCMRSDTDSIWSSQTRCEGRGIHERTPSPLNGVLSFWDVRSSTAVPNLETKPLFHSGPEVPHHMAPRDISVNDSCEVKKVKRSASDDGECGMSTLRNTFSVPWV